MKSTQKMKSMSQAEILNIDEIFSIMVKPKPNQRETIKIKVEPFEKYLKGYKTPKEQEQFLLKACEHYSRYLMRQHNRDAR